MSVSRTALPLLLGVLIVGATTMGLAQKPTPTPLLDSRGLPLPFGVQPYFKPDVPLGSGPFRAVMSTESGLSAHVVYAPADLSKLGSRKLPVLVWGNGSCLYAGNRYRQFLTDVASHGYLAIAGGPMGAVEVEVGPQSNPAVRQAGAPAPAAGAGRGGRGDAQATAQPQQRVTVALLKEAIDWAIAQNSDAASRFRDKLDTNAIVVMGHSCGGGLAVQLATEDSRVQGLGIWFSGAGLAGARGNDAASLMKIRGPVLLITGEEKLDIAYANGKATFEALNHVPIFYGWQDELQHIGNFGAKNGGEMAVIARNWLEWTIHKDAKAGAMFKGASCGLCKDSSWHIARKKIE